jgi:hypothetical protein
MQIIIPDKMVCIKIIEVFVLKRIKHKAMNNGYMGSEK